METLEERIEEAKSTRRLEVTPGEWDQLKEAFGEQPITLSFELPVSRWAAGIDIVVVDPTP